MFYTTTLKITKEIFALRSVDNWKHRLRLESACAASCKWATFTRQLSCQKLLQIRSTFRSNKKTLFGKRVMKHTHCRWKYRLQNHILICFYLVRTSKKMFFSSEHEFKKALRDTLIQAAWYELLWTMANCGKKVKFLSLGISIITWVIILKQLFASGSWIFTNIHFAFSE